MYKNRFLINISITLDKTSLGNTEGQVLNSGFCNKLLTPLVSENT